MGLTTDFNASPYYDDFDETKNFHRVLFKPGVALQARELTQLQTILQNQVERFGNNILKEGTIIQGCNFSEIKSLAYVKILDLNTNGQPVAMSQYDGAVVQGATTGVRGVIQTYADGLESQDPDLNTLFFKYTTSGSSNSEIKTLNNNENLYILDSSNNLIDTVTAAGSVLTTPADAVGKAYGVKTSDGIIYQKGFFSRVDEQLTVVAKYSNTPNNVVVGFQTTELIVNSSADTSLLDNAAGYNNYQAPGADRLQLTPVLVTMTKAESNLDSTFFAIQEYMYGRVVRRNNDTQYNTILNTIEKRTKEESGNYTVNDFGISTSNSANTSAISLNIGKGVAYVEGKRVELLNKISIDIPKSTDYLTEQSQNISTNYGNYVLVKEYMGHFDVNLGANVALYDAYQTNVTDGSIGSATGNSIGTAKVMSIVYDSGTVATATATYKMYLSDIRMNSAKNWADVKAVIYNTNVGTADLVYNTIYDQSFKRRLFNSGRSSVKALPAATTSAYYTFRSVNNSVTMAANGNLSFTLPSGEWPYSVGALTTDQKKDLILVAGATSSPYVNNKPIDLTSATVTVTNTTNISITVGAPAGSISNCNLYYNAKKDLITSPTAKVLETVYVKIACNTASSNSTGPWSLGFPDVFRIDNIYVGNTAIGYQDANTAADKTSYFALSTNQKDDYYGLATISKTSGVTLVANSNLVVKLTRFKKSGTDKGFFTVSSYPIDDANTANTAAIQTYNIPRYTSADGITYDLRDVADFRPYAANTAANAATSVAATVNPASTISFNTGSELFIPTPNKELVADYSYYLDRKDLLMINESGEFAVKSGSPSEDPVPPNDPSIGMVLADITIPAYPSLPSSVANSIRKPEYGVSISTRNNRRYTMRDVGNIDARISSLEYYTALNLLETDTKDLIISDSSGLNRFKNGIMVDNFDDLLGADLDDIEYKAGYDITSKEIVPVFTETPLKLKLDTTLASSNIDSTLQYNVTLNRNAYTKLIEQPYATTSRSLAGDAWSFKGQTVIYPEFDGGRDTTITPEPTQGEDIYTYSSNGVTLKKDGVTVSQTLNNSFMRPQNIRIQVTGLRPSTRHYIAFDGEKVDAFCAPGEFATTGNTNPSNIYATDPSGTSISTDSNGQLLAVFNMPQNRFYVGERILEIADVNDFTTIDDYTSYASVKYSSYTDNEVETTDADNGNNNGLGIVAAFVGFFAIFDPIAQTFMIRADHGKDSVIVLSKLDLYFNKKSSNSGRGVTVQIRETDNGYPSSTLKVKNGSSYVKNSNINVSTTGATATTVIFNDPVILKTGSEYALVIIPDNNDPDFRVYSSKLGQKDLLNTTLQVSQDTFDGVLFSSSNGRAWTAYQDENLKFSLYTGQYDKSGIAYFTHRDHEFLEVSVTSGSFTGNETVVKINANLTPTIATSKSNNIITTSADLSTVFSAGEYIGYWANNSVVDLLKVTSSNTTAIVCAWKPKYANTAAKVFRTTAGDISHYNVNTGQMHLLDSISKSGSAQTYFTDTNTIKGIESGAVATITDVFDYPVSALQAHIKQNNYTYTDTKYTINKVVDATGVNSYSGTVVSLKNDTTFNKTPAVIMSRSNEILTGNAQSFRIATTLNSTEVSSPYDSTPIINYGASSIDAFRYIINNDSTNETRSIGGSARSKFIGKPAILAENLDAEDLNVYLTAYRPANTTIEVYARFKNKNDPRPFNEIEWTKLTLKDSSNLRSSSANLFDYREFEYNMPSVATDASLTNGGGAALDLSTSGDVLTYKDLDGAIYTGYKQYAIKIVLLAESYAKVPKVKNYRAIALT